MSLRTRLVLAASSAVVLAIVIASATIYFATQRQLSDQIDDTLRDRMVSVQLPGRVAAPRGFVRDVLPRLGAPGGYTQVVTAAGDVLATPTGEGELPPTETALRIARSGGRAVFETVTVEGQRIRVLTAPGIEGTAVQVARPLDELDETLQRLRVVLLAVTVGGGLLAALGALGVARVVTRPVNRLSAAAERVSRTHDLSERIEVRGDDEVARLGRSFNEMLAALDESLRSQRALVADASHELRTPLTSLRTNIEVLMRADELDASERAQLAADIDVQIVELTAIVGDVIELGRGSAPVTHVADVRLDEVVVDAIVRAESHWPSVTFEVTAAPCVVAGEADRISRAIDNLLDNAAKWSPEGGAVTVDVRDGVVDVADEGPGVAPGDRSHVFDRFWRSAEGRRLPGSGLGLAIVEQVAERHGGSVDVDEAPSGGARFRFMIPDVGPVDDAGERSEGVPTGPA